LCVFVPLHPIHHSNWAGRKEEEEEEGAGGEGKAGLNTRPVLQEHLTNPLTVFKVVSNATKKPVT
jgi:hypothetical protein